MARILIVDDDAPIRRVIRAHLEADGHAVDEAESGEAALRLAGAAPPHLILLDGGLVRSGGIDLLAELGRLLPASPVVAMWSGAGGVTGHEPADATRLGARFVIEKPFRLEALRLVIHEALARRGGPGPAG
jgi:two-component system KDP operon response regulator KdpE